MFLRENHSFFYIPDCVLGRFYPVKRLPTQALLALRPRIERLGGQLLLVREQGCLQRVRWRIVLLHFLRVLAPLFLLDCYRLNVAVVITSRLVILQSRRWLLVSIFV